MPRKGPGRGTAESAFALDHQNSRAGSVSAAEGIQFVEGFSFNFVELRRSLFPVVSGKVAEDVTPSTAYCLRTRPFAKSTAMEASPPRNPPPIARGWRKAQSLDRGELRPRERTQALGLSSGK